ncbi:polysaccharide pyruvyl transferase family protein [Desulfolithobacter sp.]
MAKRVLFAGAYGIRSQGDDAALLVLYRELKRRCPDLKGAVISRHATEDLYKPYGLDTLPNFEHESRKAGQGRWFRGFNHDDDRRHLYCLLSHIENADLLILGAGNAFVDYTIDLLKGPVPYFVILTLMAQMTDTPVLWFGVSIGPLETTLGRKMTRLAAKLADAISVRDRKSAEYLHALGHTAGIHILPDPVLGLEPIHHSQYPFSFGGSRSKRELFAVSVRAVARQMGMEYKRYIETMASSLDQVIEYFNVNMLFIPHCTYEHGSPEQDDRTVARAITEQMQHQDAVFSINHHLSVDEALTLYKTCDLAICTRLHANVYAAIQGVPSVAIGYHPKVASFMDFIGCNSYCIPLAHLRPKTIIHKTKDLMQNKISVSATVRNKIDRTRTDINRYADLAIDLMR